MKHLVFLASLIAPSLCATEKGAVSLVEHGHSSGCPPRNIPEVTVSDRETNEPFAIGEQLAALRQQIAYLELMEKHKVDLSKKVTAAYEETPLKEVLKELLPGVPVMFKGVDENQTVEAMAVLKSSLYRVLGHLDEAAGVYFTFGAAGITVSADPPVIE